MESFKIENLSFKYPVREKKALDNISISISQGEFVTVCGRSGCGKTTLLRLLKPSLAPFGEIEGKIFFNGQFLEELDKRGEAACIGFVMQSPKNQIVTDKVWHELAFGLESLGYSKDDIRSRVSEMASFFGIEGWFHKKITELSGGQKQLLNLASVMAISPSVLILDEPTSQLDPIAAQEFLKAVEKINRDLGVTVILTEHRLEDALPLSDRVIVMDEGKIIADDKPCRVGEILKKIEHAMYIAMPAPMRIYSAVEKTGDSPVAIREGRCWLEEYVKEHGVKPLMCQKEAKYEVEDIVLEIKDGWFRYEKKLPDVIKGLNVQIGKGEIFALLGGNGTGKTTALSLMAGINFPYRGQVFINGKDISKQKNLYRGTLGVLPQNPQSVFVKNTVYLDLLHILSGRNLSKEEMEEKVLNMAKLCRIEKFLYSHPYDLSGGEQQRAALGKVLLTEPEILLLDEPTKGMDAHFKEEFADILYDLKDKGVSIVMVSHDVEFCAEYADRCALMFDGEITSSGRPREFFSGKNFYTTSTNRMARTTFPDALLPEDVISHLGGEIKKKERRTIEHEIKKNMGDENSEKIKKLPLSRILAGGIFLLVFILTSVAFYLNWFDKEMLKLLGIVEIAGVLFSFFPKSELGVKSVEKTKGKLEKRTLFAALLILLAIPITIYVGINFLGDRKYYFISLLVMIETMLPFCLVFEKRKPQAREIVIISVLCAVAVAGRAVFFMLPEFKPVVPIIIIAAICFGGETGFLVGAVTGFVSNFFFGQGPWTPWQMFALGIIGFVGGVVFKKGLMKRTKAAICVFGFLATLIIYGGIMNPASVIMWQNEITKEMIISAYMMGIPFDLVHALSTAFFLWFIAGPMVEKLERIKIKYGLIN